MQLHALSQLSSVIAVLLFWSNFCLAFDSSKSITNLHYHAQEAFYLELTVITQNCSPQEKSWQKKIFLKVKQEKQIRS